MSNEHPHLDEQQVAGISKPSWFASLVHETTQLDHAGVNAAILSIRIQPDRDSDRRSIQLRNLLGRVLRPTDQFGQTSPTTFSLLLAPLDSIADTTSRVHSITRALRSANLSVSAGYAQRRSGESLLDTWARAEAQADRAAFRSRHTDGLSLVE